MVNEMFLPRENVRNYLQFLQRLLKSCKSNLSANDNGCIKMDEVSYLSHTANGNNAAPSVDYVGSFKLICQLTSHDHSWLYFSSSIMDICDRPSNHVEVTGFYRILQYLQLENAMLLQHTSIL